MSMVIVGIAVLQSFLSGYLLSTPTSVSKSHGQPNRCKAGLLIPAIHTLTPTETRLPHSSVRESVFVISVLPGTLARNTGLTLTSFFSFPLFHLQTLSDSPSKYFCVIPHMNCFNFFLTDLPDSIFPYSSLFLRKSA